MKLSIVVLTPGSGEGTIISINSNQFLIGRDPDCHLRPASVHISNRHCVILQRDDKVFLRDFGSTNGTFVNDRRIEASEIELHDGDRLRVGPLLFTFLLEPEPVTTRTQALPIYAVMQNGRSNRAANPGADGPDRFAGSEDGAATLLVMQERGVPDAGQPTEAPDITTLPDASFATLADKEKEKPKQTSGDPSIAPAAGVIVGDDARTAAEKKIAEAKQTAVVEATGLKIRKFLLGFLLGFAVTALSLSAWAVSLLTVVDWFRGDSWFFSRFPSPVPLWLAVVLAVAVPLLTLRLIRYIRKHRIRSR